MTVLVRFQLIFLNNRSKVYCISRSFAEQAFSRTQQYTNIDCQKKFMTHVCHPNKREYKKHTRQKSSIS